MLSCFDTWRIWRKLFRSWNSGVDWGRGLVAVLVFVVSFLSLSMPPLSKSAPRQEMSRWESSSRNNMESVISILPASRLSFRDTCRRAQNGKEPAARRQSMLYLACEGCGYLYLWVLAGDWRWSLEMKDGRGTGNMRTVFAMRLFLYRYLGSVWSFANHDSSSWFLRTFHNHEVEPSTINETCRSEYSIIVVIFPVWYWFDEFSLGLLLRGLCISKLPSSIISKWLTMSHCNGTVRPPDNIESIQAYEYSFHNMSRCLGVSPRIMWLASPSSAAFEHIPINFVLSFPASSSDVSDGNRKGVANASPCFRSFSS